MISKREPLQLEKLENGRQITRHSGFLLFRLSRRNEQHPSKSFTHLLIVSFQNGLSMSRPMVPASIGAALPNASQSTAVSCTSPSWHNASMGSAYSTASAAGNSVRESMSMVRKRPSLGISEGESKLLQADFVFLYFVFLIMAVEQVNGHCLINEEQNALGIVLTGKGHYLSRAEKGQLCGGESETHKC